MPATWMGREATSVIAAAYTLAAAGRRTVIAEEHLLEALVTAARGAHLLAPLTLATVQNEIVPAVAQARHAGGLSCGDGRALAGLGWMSPTSGVRGEWRLTVCALVLLAWTALGLLLAPRTLRAMTRKESGTSLAHRQMLAQERAG